MNRSARLIRNLNKPAVEPSPREVANQRCHLASGFTLVELLVVIAIIGVLIGLLLPAVQAARESARRSECVNRQKQVGVATHNLLEVYKTFPSAGIGPWPNITLGGNAVQSPDSQEIGWGFQILPFMEQEAIHDYRSPVVNAKNVSRPFVEAFVATNAVWYYFCPSRRSPTSQERRYLMDYASSVPTAMNLQETTPPVFDWMEYWCAFDSINNSWDSKIDTHGRNLPVNGVSKYKCTAFGIINRTPYFGKATRPEQVVDGLSSTMMYGEKWIRKGAYDTGEWYDDRGWTDGYDPDVVRSTALPPRPDDEIDDGNDPFAMGGAHPSGFNACFGDGAVHYVTWEVDPIVYNRWGNREDELPAAAP
jgi:prepilin-type N-terminal cleavage/methylation domain-containing protein